MITNVQGQILLNSQIIREKQEINISDFAPGIYYIIEVTKNIGVEKFIKL